MIVSIGALIICRLDRFSDVWLSGDGGKHHVLLTDLADFEMHTPIHIAADIAVVETERAFFPETDHLDDLVGDTLTDQKLFHFFSSHQSQLVVVADRALLVGIALDENAEVVIVLRQVGLRGEDRLGVVCESFATYLEIDIRMDAVRLVAGSRDDLVVHGRLDLWGRAGLEYVRDLRVAHGLSRGLRDVRLTLPGVVPEGSDDNGKAQDHPAYDVDLLRAFIRSDNGGGYGS